MSSNSGLGFLRSLDPGIVVGKHEKDGPEAVFRGSDYLGNFRSRTAQAVSAAKSSRTCSSSRLVSRTPSISDSGWSPSHSMPT